MSGLRIVIREHDNAGTFEIVAKFREPFPGTACICRCWNPKVEQPVGGLFALNHENDVVLSNAF